MIKNIIFDFGDVFINLDKEIVIREFVKWGGSFDALPEIVKLNEQYEVGALSSDAFIGALNHIIPEAKPSEIIKVWNGMLLDFPDHRLEFIETLAKVKSHRLFLLSNTNALHIPHVAKRMGKEKFNRFKQAFEQFYLSHEIQMRKPDTEIFTFVLQRNGLKAEETLFIDDTKENTDAAATLGIKTWHLLVGKEEVTELKLDW
ncbi:HAD family phosphatase [Arenibacter sp. GZD96]|uniref:HAD family hydrolase n=1 Tax=Aurantibrevibacter litoralis TaxID=3106030 RepID=UPI002AFE09FD|nr:HAD family phosphatase [Arenibacter sp. GZD-96]MEA1786328.1 HAD family phosphatase [Arenibacter sp. GZD-96]